MVCPLKVAFWWQEQEHSMFKELRLQWATEAQLTSSVWHPLRLTWGGGGSNLFLFQPPAVSRNSHLHHRLIHLSARNGSIHGWRGQLQGVGVGGRAVRSLST